MSDETIRDPLTYTHTMIRGRCKSHNGDQFDLQTDSINATEQELLEMFEMQHGDFLQGKELIRKEWIDVNANHLILKTYIQQARQER